MSLIKAALTLSLAWLPSDAAAAAAAAGDVQRVDSTHHAQHGPDCTFLAALADAAEGAAHGSEGQPLSRLLGPFAATLLLLLCVLVAGANVLRRSKALAKAIDTQFPLKQLDLKEDEDVETCAICLVDMQAGDYCRELECKHHFHAECIKAWWTTSTKAQCNGNCPLCRHRQHGLTQLLTRAHA
eukprot:CAMPEP_0195154578 /NCGR_PEP_ID=MMETSP0448-20130528/183726_1 /TAXON_ID=66468 /ORGANISM="Heterocapsa triquestra, Strain CCMP 448" /LENGTH=183 /DNA_ID=CAMNT_0040193355 /DNA_START=31 /DNA_END=582 /DNA_ORIENTATION=-